MSLQPSLPRADRLLGAALFAGTVALLWATHAPVGHVRDEGYYFHAAHDYEGWFVQLGDDVSKGRLLEPFRESSIARHWSYNSEHPPLAKVAFALSHLSLHEKTGLLDETTAYRVPAFLFGGLLSLALFLLCLRFGRATAVLAPLLFWAVPRHFFNGHLACFDIPVTAMWLLFLHVWARYVETGKGALAAGIVFGLALSTKHNAFFLPIVVVLHWLITDRRDLRAAGIRGVFGRIPAGFWSMALVGPVVLYLSWPWLWHHPIERLRFWITFHQQHVHYPWQYFGEVLRAPPFPFLYPLGLEAVTLPAATLVAMSLAVVAALGRWRSWTRTEWLLALGAFVAVAPFLTSRVPIFGGIKHWMPGIAVLCVPTARLLVEAARALVPSRPALAAAALGAFVLVPGALATAHFHPWGTSAYNELAGGAAGGAALGMQRQFWSNNVTAVLPWLNEHAPRGAQVYFHEVNWESFRAYQEDGLLRRDLGYASEPRHASIAAYQYHQEFRDREFEIWDAMGTRVPSLSFAIDEAPQVDRRAGLDPLLRQVRPRYPARRLRHAPALEASREYRPAAARGGAEGRAEQGGLRWPRRPTGSRGCG